MNKYGSIERIFEARNVAESTVVPPADLTIANTSFVTGLLGAGTSQFVPLTNSNIIIKRLGVFSNFADGLVFKEPAVFMQATIRFQTGNFIAAANGGTVTLALGSKTLTGIGTKFLLDIGPAGVVDTPIRIGSTILMVHSVTNNTTATLADYAPYDLIAPGLAYTIFDDKGTATGIYDLPRVLNETFVIDDFLAPVVTNPLSTVSFDVITCSIGLVGGSQITFLTKSIDTAFANDKVFFDVNAEVEYTRT